MAASFRDPFDGEAEAWKPAEIGTSYGNRYLRAIGRLGRGTSAEAATAELTTLTSGLVQRRPKAYRDWSVRVVDLHEAIAGDVRRLLTILLAFVVLVLVLASANVANLVVARGTGRDREHAVRAALGAGRVQLFRQAAIEGLVLATVSAAAGALLAAGIVQSIVGLRPEALPRLDSVTFSWRVWMWSAGSALAVAIASSLPASLRAARSDPERLLRIGAATLTSGGRHRAFRGSLVALQVAIACVVLSMAGLLVESFGRLSAVDLGFRTEGVTTFRIGLPAARYPKGGDREAFHQRLADSLAAIPGVANVGMVSKLPANGAFHTWSFRVDGRAEVRPGEPFGLTDVRCVGGQYFQALGIALLSGRMLSETDHEGGQPVAVISASMARRYWPGDNPIGQRFSFGEPAGWWTVVGVVGDVHHDHRTAPVPAAYVRHAQIGGDRNWPMIQVVRSSVPPAALLPEVRSIVRRLDPELVVYDVASLSDVAARDIARPRFSASLMLGFGILALLIAAAGIFAVVSYSVAERTREIGLRMAVGADGAGIRRMLVRSIARLDGGGTGDRSARDGRGRAGDRLPGGRRSSAGPSGAHPGRRVAVHGRRAGRIHPRAEGDANRSDPGAADRVAPCILAAVPAALSSRSALWPPFRPRTPWRSGRRAADLALWNPAAAMPRPPPVGRIRSRPHSHVDNPHIEVYTHVGCQHV